MITVTSEIEKGYKESELGLIPEDWDVLPLKNVAKYRRGTFPQPYGLNKWYDNINGMPFIQVYDVAENFKLKDHTKRLISVLAQNMSVFVKKGSIVLTIQGSIGRIAITQYDAYVDRTLLLFESYLIATDIYYFAYSVFVLFEKEKLYAPGGIIKTITKERLSGFLIAIPPLAEQKNISKVLLDLDLFIENLEKLIDKKEAIKQGTMQQLLTGKKRLPGFSGEWKARKLGEICEIKTGKKNNDDKVIEGLYPFFVRSQHIERINSYSFDGEAILIPGEGNIGSIYHYINGKFDYHQRVYKISNFAVLYSGMFIYLSMSQNFNSHAMKNSVKATVDSLRLPTFQEFEILFPPTIEEQTAIATILSDMDIEIESLKQKLNKYIMLKQGMMQQLLTGNIRVYATN